MPSYDGTTVDGKKISYNTDDVAIVEHLTADPSKFSVIQATSGDKTLYPVVYDNKAFILVITGPANDFRGEQRFFTYGVKKCYEYDKPNNKFTDIFTGEYQFGIKLVNEIKEGTTYKENLNPCEAKLIAILDAIYNAEKQACSTFGLLKPALVDDMVRPIYTFSPKKGPDGKPIKHMRENVPDFTKSPTLNVNCNWSFDKNKGYKHIKGTKVPADVKVLTTKFKKIQSASLWKPDEIDGPCKGVYFIQFRDMKESLAKWGTKAIATSAILTPVARVDFDPSEQYREKYAMFDAVETQAPPPEDE